MAFPFVTNVRTVMVRQVTPALPQRLALTRVAFRARFFNSAFPPMVRTVTVRQVTPALPLRLTENRVWNGIGGQSYLPSFPQLDRHNTTFPKAL